MNQKGENMDLIIKILHAAVKKNWPIALRIFLIGLLCAIAYPILTVLAGINGNALSPAIIKVVLALACVVTSAAILWQWQWMWNTLPQWWRSGIPLLGVAAIMLLCGTIPPVRSLGVGLGMIMSSMGLFIVAAYAFMTRFLYAALIEAPTSAETDVADAELPAKAVLRTILAILAWEWFGAWYLTTFSPQITMTTGLFAFFSLGIAVLTSYSLGYKGETARKILLYGAITALILLSLILLDRMIQQGDVTNFLTSGYIGRELKVTETVPSSRNWLMWFVLCCSIIIAGRIGSYFTEKDIVCIVAIYIVIVLVIYLIASWMIAVKTPIFSGEQIKWMIGVGDVPVNVNITRRWFWVIGAVGELAILLSGRRYRVDPETKKTYVSRKFPFAGMVTFLLALLLFDWVWWQQVTMYQMCESLRIKFGLSEKVCQ